MQLSAAVRSRSFCDSPSDFAWVSNSSHLPDQTNIGIGSASDSNDTIGNVLLRYPLPRSTALPVIEQHMMDKESVACAIALLEYARSQRPVLLADVQYWLRMLNTEEMGRFSLEQDNSDTSSETESQLLDTVSSDVYSARHTDFPTSAAAGYLSDTALAFVKQSGYINPLYSDPVGVSHSHSSPRSYLLHNQWLQPQVSTISSHQEEQYRQLVDAIRLDHCYDGGGNNHRSNYRRGNLGNLGDGYLDTTGIASRAYSDSVINDFNTTGEGSTMTAGSNALEGLYINTSIIPPPISRRPHRGRRPYRDGLRIDRLVSSGMQNTLPTIDRLSAAGANFGDVALHGRLNKDIDYCMLNEVSSDPEKPIVKRRRGRKRGYPHVGASYSCADVQDRLNPSPLVLTAGIQRVMNSGGRGRGSRGGRIGGGLRGRRAQLSALLAGRELHTCTRCRKSFIKRHYLVRHQRRMHQDTGGRVRRRGRGSRGAFMGEMERGIEPGSLDYTMCEEELMTDSNTGMIESSDMFVDKNSSRYGYSEAVINDSLSERILGQNENCTCGHLAVGQNCNCQDIKKSFNTADTSTCGPQSSQSYTQYSDENHSSLNVQRRISVNEKLSHNHLLSHDESSISSSTLGRFTTPVSILHSSHSTKVNVTTHSKVNVTTHTKISVAAHTKVNVSSMNTSGAYAMQEISDIDSFSVSRSDISFSDEPVGSKKSLERLKNSKAVTESRSDTDVIGSSGVQGELVTEGGWARTAGVGGSVSELGAEELDEYVTDRDCVEIKGIANEFTLNGNLEQMNEFGQMEGIRNDLKVKGLGRHTAYTEGKSSSSGVYIKADVMSSEIKATNATALINKDSTQLNKTPSLLSYRLSQNVTSLQFYNASDKVRGSLTSKIVVDAAANNNISSAAQNCNASASVSNVIAAPCKDVLNNIGAAAMTAGFTCRSAVQAANRLTTISAGARLTTADLAVVSSGSRLATASTESRTAATIDSAGVGNRLAATYAGARLTITDLAVASNGSRSVVTGSLTGMAVTAVAAITAGSKGAVTAGIESVAIATTVDTDLRVEDPASTSILALSDTISIRTDDLNQDSLNAEFSEHMDVSNFDQDEPYPYEQSDNSYTTNSSPTISPVKPSEDSYQGVNNILSGASDTANQVINTLDITVTNQDEELPTENRSDSVGAACSTRPITEESDDSQSDYGNSLQICLDNDIGGDIQQNDDDNEIESPIETSYNNIYSDISDCVEGSQNDDDNCDSGVEACRNYRDTGGNSNYTISAPMSGHQQHCGSSYADIKVQDQEMESKAPQGYDASNVACNLNNDDLLGEQQKQSGSCCADITDQTDSKAPLYPTEVSSYLRSSAAEDNNNTNVISDIEEKTLK